MYDQEFSGIDFTKFGMKDGEYENCHFKHCQFQNLSWKKIKFIDCTFTDCDISNVDIDRTAFRTVIFNDCKMIGLRFDNILTLFLKIDFLRCKLDHSVFNGLLLKGQQFEDCSLLEVEFVECNLSESKFMKCDLQRAIFEYTDLRKADFISSYNFKIDPEKNTIAGAKFSRYGIEGLLDKYDIVIE
jgi:uncharacterized protein YjbI with pentapeptide repeats